MFCRLIRFAAFVAVLPATTVASALDSLTIRSIEPESPLKAGLESSVTVAGRWDTRGTTDRELFGIVTAIHPEGPIISKVRAPVSARDGLAEFKFRLRSSAFDFAGGGFHIFALITSEDGDRLAFARNEVARHGGDARPRAAEQKRVPDSSITFDDDSPTGGKQSMTMQGYINGTGEYGAGKDDNGATCQVVAIVLRAKNKDTNALYKSLAQNDGGRWFAQIVNLPAATYEVSADLTVMGMGEALGCVDSTTDTKEIVIDP